MSKTVWPDKVVTRRFTYPNRPGYADIVVSRKEYRYWSVGSPNYPRQVRQNPCQIGYREYTCYPELVRGDWTYPAVADDIDDGTGRFPGLAADLDRKILKKISARKMEFLLLAVERRKTFELMYQVAKQTDRVIDSAGRPQDTLKRALRNAKKKNRPKSVRRLSRKLSALQLQYAFAIKPLLTELYTLANSIGKGMLRFYVNATVSDSEFSTGVKKFVLYKQDESFRLKSTGHVEFDMTDPLKLLLSELGLSNPATVLWEVTPWSFAVDWLVGIGDFLAQFDAWNGINYVSGSNTLTFTQDITATWQDWTENRGSARKVASLKNRYTSYKPSFSLPEISNPFTSLDRARNQIALIIGKGIRH